MMKRRLVRVFDFSVTDNHLYFPSDPKQKYLPFELISVSLRMFTSFRIVVMNYELT